MDNDEYKFLWGWGGAVLPSPHVDAHNAYPGDGHWTIHTCLFYKRILSATSSVGWEAFALCIRGFFVL